MAYGFKCPKCGGFKWGTLDCGKPKQEWIGVCNGDRDYPGCGFRWHRATEDEKIIGIPFGVHDKTPNRLFGLWCRSERKTMLMKPPTVPANHANAPSYDELVNALELIRHATAPTPDDGGHHEAAHDLADSMLKRVEARRQYEAQKRAFDTLPDDYECPHC